jgi:prepilin-type N-terminal cleavage/methylation domain-containing protein
MSKKSQIKERKGFTIIEVVLVLAIAGLIFMMVFLALPALQRSQRNTQRRNDLGIVSAAIQSFMSNNRGAVPRSATCTLDNNQRFTNTTGFATGDGAAFCNYVGEASANVMVIQVVNPLGGGAAAQGIDGLVTAAATAANADRTNMIIVYTQASCNPTNPGNEVIRVASRNSAAVVMLTEGGNNSVIPICVDV